MNIPTAVDCTRSKSGAIALALEASMPLSTRCALVACIAFALGAAAAGAEELTLASAVERTLARNPELRVYAPRRTAAQERAQVAALRPRLELQAETQDAFGTGRASGFDTAETTFALSHVIELGSKRALRFDAATARTAIVDAERAIAELDVLAEVTRRLIHVAADQEHLALTMRATALAEENVSAATARVAAARAPDVELRRARVTSARAAVEQEHAEHELLTSRRKLAAMWGDSEPLFERVSADLYTLPPAEGYEALATRLAENPDFARFASEERLRDAELRVAEAHARTDVTVRAGVRLLHDTNDEALVFGVTLPLQAAARARNEIAAARAEREQTAAEREAHRVRAEAQLFELFQELRHAITEADVLRTTVLPEMEAALEATRYAFERGRYSYLEWVDAQRELVEVQRALIEAAANAHLYRTEIERLTGEPLQASTEALP
jgi:cobalt-zinc-cadmium efflux system outer membrane protein